MSKKTLIVGVGLIAALLASTAFAAQPSAYFGADVGRSKGSLDAPFTTSQDDTGTSLRLFGGVDLNPNVSLEAGYINFGTFSVNQAFTDGTYDYYSATDVKAWSLYAAAIGRLPISKTFNVYGKLGLHRWDLSVDTGADVYNAGTTTKVGTLNSSTSDNGIDPLFGVGAQWNVSTTVAVQAEWTRYTSIGNDTVGKSDVDVLGVGGLVRF